MIFGQKKINEAVELERQQAQEVLQDVHATVANLEVSIDGVTEKIGHVSDETANISSVMQEFTASMEEMSSNINELSDTMGEMDEAFQQMSEEAKEGADYAQNSNNDAYDIMKRSEEERREVEAKAQSVEVAMREKIEQSKRADSGTDKRHPRYCRTDQSPCTQCFH